MKKKGKQQTAEKEKTGKTERRGHGNGGMGKTCPQF